MAEAGALKLSPMLGQKNNEPSILRRFLSFDHILLLIGFATCALCGPLPQYNLILSFILLTCVVLSIRSNTFYVYAALFMYFREFMLLGGSTVYRVYSYLVIFKVILDIKNVKLRVAALPPMIVFSLFCIFGIGRLDMRAGIQSLMDLVVLYFILAKILADDDLMRLYLFVFLLGGVASGIFGWTAEASVNIDVGVGVTTEITRVYGALYDANYAGFYYSVCLLTVMLLKGLKWWMRAAFGAYFFVVLFQTGSLSGLLTCLVALVLVVIMKYRSRSIPFLVLLFFCLIGFAIAAWNVPAVRNIAAIGSIVTRVNEKMMYLALGRWDMLTTGRYDLWQTVVSHFNRQPMLGKLFGGNVITTLMTDESLFHKDLACHQMYLQSLLNFGIVGAITIFLSLASTFVYRIFRFFTVDKRAENSDIKMIQISFVAVVFVFGLSVGYFVDWRFLFFFLI